jgi:hypothetical protein
VIEAQWLTLDDNDGNIGNGTPHYFDIDGGFVAQGFPGIPFDPISISNVTQLPDTTNQTGPYNVQGTAVSNLSGGSITSGTLFYRVGSTGGFTNLAMTPIGGNAWSASIPGQTAPSKVFYYLQFVDSATNSLVYPKNSPATALFFDVGNVQQLFCDSFETINGWVASNTGFNQGDWVLGDPLGTLNNGVQAQPEFDNTPNGTKCFFTGQGTSQTNPNENDVDGGPHTLTSPPINVALDNAEVRYAYWMYNDDGDDSLLVQLSNNGTTWVTARTYQGGNGGWNTDKIDVGSFVTPSSTLYLRFSISDTPNNSVTEAAVDDVCFSTIAPVGCAQPVPFCFTKIDSNFCAPRVSFNGLARVSGNQPLTISVNQTSNQRSGLLFYGYATTQQPFKGGTLCCQPPVRRTPIQSTGGSTSGADCSGSMSFDFNAYIRSGIDPNLIAGQSCATQFYYRDPLDTFGLGLSDALMFTICP